MNEKKIHQVRGFCCSVPACKHWGIEAEGGCTLPDPDIIVWSVEDGGSHAGGGCLSFEQDLQKIDTKHGERIMGDQHNLEEWNLRPGADN